MVYIFFKGVAVPEKVAIETRTSQGDESKTTKDEKLSQSQPMVQNTTPKPAVWCIISHLYHIM